jgi:hypothetical protein
MYFDWDEANIAHIAEHNVLPSEAEEAVTGKPIYLNYQVKSDEDRFMQIGETSAGRVLVVVITPRNALTRVVTAFPANRAYRAFYASERDVQYGDREESSS